MIIYVNLFIGTCVYNYGYDYFTSIRGSYAFGSYNQVSYPGIMMCFCFFSKANLLVDGSQRKKEGVKEVTRCSDRWRGHSRWSWSMDLNEMIVAVVVVVVRREEGGEREDREDE